MLQGWDTSWTVRRIDAAAALDAAGNQHAHASGISAVVERRPDGSLALAALGPTAEVAQSSRWTGVATTDRHACLLIPGLVNAHTHLDLTHIGPRPHDPAAGFAVWIDMIRRERLADPATIAGSVGSGVDLSLAGGVVLLGDIAGAVGGRPSSAAAAALIDAGRVNGVSYIEFFAQGARGELALAAVLTVWRSLASQSAPRPRVEVGVHPHAPYSVGFEYYASLLRQLPPGTPLCTHLAESLHERAFVASATGPFRNLLESLSLWDERTASPIGKGRTPIEHLGSVLSEGVVPVHCNDVTDADLDTLQKCRVPPVYCPRASAYFAADRDFGPHRYRDMLAAGIKVALGTDSIINLDTPGRISVWDEMRLLHRRDCTDPLTLLAMATLNGAAALRRDPAAFALAELGTLAGLVAIPVPITNRGSNPPELLGEALSASGSGVVPELLAIGRV